MQIGLQPQVPDCRSLLKIRLKHRQAFLVLANPHAHSGNVSPHPEQFVQIADAFTRAKGLKVVLQRLLIPEPPFGKWKHGVYYHLAYLGGRLTKQLTNTVVPSVVARSEEHTSELQSLRHLVCRLL